MDTNTLLIPCKKNNNSTSCKPATTAICSIAWTILYTVSLLDRFYPCDTLSQCRYCDICGHFILEKGYRGARRGRYVLKRE